jgi:diadenosine tetraphosphate (Ap4A) HIT family hydrolase
MNKLPKPFKEAIIYEDKKLYACLANYPIVKGHTIIVWKKKAKDLHLLSKRDYEYLMDKVDEIRNALLKTLKLKKVYLIYMDETNQVHWHLIPRYNEQGYDILKHKPSKLKDFSLANKIKSNLVLKLS